MRRAASSRTGTLTGLPYGIILLSGVFTLLVPVLKGPVLKATVSWGLRSGAFASSLALFGPALFLLGCVSPYLVKIAARRCRTSGGRSGVFYAISTVGSFVGTVLTGFVLIAYFGVNAIFYVHRTLLIALAAGYFLLFRKKVAVLAVLVLPLLFLHQEGPVSKVMANGTRVTKVFSKDTPMAISRSLIIPSRQTASGTDDRRPHPGRHGCERPPVRLRICLLPGVPALWHQSGGEELPRHRAGGRPGPGLVRSAGHQDRYRGY